ncbi:hypothetical protein Tco_1117411 [Tanacetum coccineum]
MDDPNITMEEYIRLEEEKARRRDKVFNWETAKYGKIWYDEDVDDLRSVETEFPAIVFSDRLTSEDALPCEPMVSSLNDNKIDFKISFDESDDEDYTVIFDKNSFSYKIISANDLKTDSENDNEKVNMPLFPSYEATVSCLNDLYFFKDFENEFSVIVYNDALTSKLDFSTEPTLSPQHIDKFDLKNETSLSEFDEEEQNILYFNDLFPFNKIYPDDLKSDKDNYDDKIDMIQSLGGNENTQGSNKLLEASHDKTNKVFIMKDFIMELNVNIVAWNYLVNRMLFNLIKNLYMSFGIPFDPKWYYKHGDCTRILQRPSYKVVGYTEEKVHNFEQRLEMIFGRWVNRVHIIDFEGLTPDMRQGLVERLRMVYTRDDGEELRGARCSMTWRQFILALGLHIAKEMEDDGFRAYWLGSERVIPNKGDLSDYWVKISSSRDFLRGTPSYTYIRDPIRRLMDRGAANVPCLLAQYLFKHAEGRKSGAMLLGGHFIGRLAHHFGQVSDGGLRGLSVVARELPFIDMERQPDDAIGAPRAAADAPAVDEERSMTDHGRFSTWMISCMTKLMEAIGQTYQAFDGTFRGSSPAVFERCTRQRTDDDNTSTAPQQPDP